MNNFVLKQLPQTVIPQFKDFIQTVKMDDGTTTLKKLSNTIKRKMSHGRHLLLLNGQNVPWSSCRRLLSQTIHCQVRRQHNEPSPGDRWSPDTGTHTHMDSVSMLKTQKFIHQKMHPHTG